MLNLFLTPELLWKILFAHQSFRFFDKHLLWGVLSLTGRRLCVKGICTYKILCLFKCSNCWRRKDFCRHYLRATFIPRHSPCDRLPIDYSHLAAETRNIYPNNHYSPWCGNAVAGNACEFSFSGINSPYILFMVSVWYASKWWIYLAASSKSHRSLLH